MLLYIARNPKAKLDIQNNLQDNIVPRICCETRSSYTLVILSYTMAAGDVCCRRGAVPPPPGSYTLVILSNTMPAGDVCCGRRAVPTPPGVP